MPSRSWVPLLIAATLALSSCGRLFKATCVKSEDYAAAVDNQPLQIPAGLQGPDTRSALPVPHVAEERWHRAVRAARPQFGCATSCSGSPRGQRGELARRHQG